MTYRSARLTAKHDTNRFDCGNPALDEWLRNQALRAERAGISATTVWTEPGASDVLAFHSIAPTQLRRDELPSKSMAGGHSTIPGYLLGRLALDTRLHGRRLGSQLLLDALELIVQAADRSDGRIVVVDAVDEPAATFYEHHDFTRVGNTNRLVMKIATVRRALR